MEKEYDLAVSGSAAERVTGRSIYMHQYIKIPGNAILAEYKLLDLSRINVVCGKNNSGKSTLLAAINDPTVRKPGVKLTDEQAKVIYDNVIKSTGWRGNSSNITENREFGKLIGSAISSKEVWYSDEGSALHQEIMQRYEQNQALRRWSPPAKQAVDSCYGAFFADQGLSILLPPKRTLEVSIPIDASAELSSQGLGVSNHLYWAKNQSESSQDHRAHAQIADAFEEISSGYRFEIFMERDNSIRVMFASNSSGWVDATDCGLGLQDLLVILYYAIHPLYRMVTIEEPESHLHPDMQRRLLHHLHSLREKQFFLSTHSNVFLNNALIDRVFFTAFDGVIRVDDATKRTAILDDLGYSVTDNLVSDLIILVEGPTDVPVIEEYLLKMGLHKDYEIKIWPLGGDIMDQLDLSVFSEKYKILALVDNDPGSASVRNRFIKNCRNLGIGVSRLKAYAIENYFSLRALREVFRELVPSDMAAIDLDKALEKQIGFSVKKNNRKLAQAMALDEISDTDLHRFFIKVQKTLRG